MFSRLLRTAAPLALILAASQASAQTDPPVAPAEMMRHIERLASDEFQGRAPGTEGERLTINYIAEQLAARGAEPAGEDGTWFQPVRLVERRAGESRVSWTANGRPVDAAGTSILLAGRDASESIADAPVVFAGHGVRMPERGIDQLAGANLDGAVVLIILQPPQGVSGFPSLAQRTRTLTEAGAAAVIAIVGDEVPWAAVTRQLSQGTTSLDSTPRPRLSGVMPAATAQRLIAASGGDFEQMLNAQPGSSFRSSLLPLRATMAVTTQVTRYNSNNVIGRIRGSGATNESVLLLGHWDHFGICRPEGEADRICNGAVDNASGIAMLLEIAGRLGRQPRPARDILFLATTSEEVGLLGAEYFAAHPVVPAASIAAAINMDTVAIHPAGEPVAVIGRGLPALDRVIDETVAAMGRRLDTDDEAAAFVSRQDGYKLMQAGIPSIMVGGSFSNMALLNAFLAGPYHAPNDQPGGTIVLDGAAEDATLTVALVRRLADPAIYQRPRPPVAEEPE
jgi:Zn-dependent M28 family amino/carboxypeptidase